MRTGTPAAPTTSSPSQPARGGVADQFLKILAPTRFEVFGPVTPELKEALAGFNPTYLTPDAGFTR